MLWFDLAPL
jgi:hypothetical protein